MLTHGEGGATIVGQLPEGTVTILFTDVVGSTPLAATVGDRPVRDRLRVCEELAREQIALHRGQQIKSTGDGMMVAFTSARRAVECAIEIQRGIERLNLARPNEAVYLRIGLNSGEVFAEHGDLHGSAANAAARIEAAAGVGEVFVSESVRLLLGPGSPFRLTDRGEFLLKGFDSPWRLYEVDWRAAHELARATRSPLVARDAERRELSRSLDAAASGRGRLVLLGGEPGVGKSRLAQDAIAEARGRGFQTFAGHCYDTESATPYNPFVEIVESVANELGIEPFMRVLGDAAAQIAKIVPSLRARVPTAATEQERPPALERRMLFDAVRAVIERLAGRRLLVLLFEDLHWADPSTAALLQHVLPRVAQLPLLIIATYRDTEAFPERPLSALLGEFVRHPQTVDLAVRRLPPSAVADLMRAYGGGDAPPRVVDLVVRETEGNPFFVEQVLKHLTEAGRLFDAEGRWRADVDVREDEVPRGVRPVISSRLDRVSADCRRTLTRAAIFGRAFSYELLRELADSASEEQLLAAMDEAEVAQLIAPEVVGGQPRLLFAHELIRQTLLSEVSLPRRQQLHARAADAIEAAAGAQAERHAAEIAHHLQQAGTPGSASRCVRYLMVAGNQALEAAAFEDAQQRFDAALALAGAEDGARIELLYRRGVAHFALGRWDLAEPDWRAALDAAEKAGSADLAGLIALDLGMQVAFARRPAEAYVVGRRGAAALAGRVSGIHARVLAFCSMVGADMRDHDFAEAVDLFGEAARIAAESGDQAALGGVLSQHAHIYWRTWQMVDSAAHYARACETLEAAGAQYALAEARTWHALALVALGRFHEAAKMLDGLEQACERVGNPGALFAARRARAFMDIAATGNLERWNAFAAADLAFLEALGSGYTANSHAYVALGKFWDGRWDEALPHARKAVELALDDSWAGHDATALLLLLAYRGEADAVRALLGAQRRHLPVAGRVSGGGAWELLPAAVDALAMIGDRAAVADLYPVALAATESGAPIHYTVKSLPETTAGIAAACGGHWDLADEHLRKALRQAHALPNRIEQPEARRWLAWMLLERGLPADREPARVLLTEAAALYSEIGMPKHRERTASLLAAVDRL